MSDRWVFTLILWSVHGAVFFAVCGVYGLLHRLEVAPRFRVVQGKAPPAPLLRRALHEVLVGQVVLLPVSAYVLFPAWRWMGGELAAPAPSLATIAWQVVACIVLQDTLFYWSHRALHTKWLFRAVHRRHHDFRYVRGLAAEYAHPLELAVNLLSIMAGPILLAVHPVTLAVWLMIRMAETVEAHSGYAFTAIASRHAYHHLYAARGCLGSFFGLWDRLMGTDQHWRRWRREQTHR
ncbi:MAG: sterol desaturase family protein [Myxococcales bacterium]|nr:sterol desaturase family protein [Myxococcales bacterium]